MRNPKPFLREEFGFTWPLQPITPMLIFIKMYDDL
jgi:hypothetical protein